MMSEYKERCRSIAIQALRNEHIAMDGHKYHLYEESIDQIESLCPVCGTEADKDSTSGDSK